MKLIVHCGMFKTGSTAIQQVFFRNQTRFLAEGVLYPRMPPVPAHHLMIARFDGNVPTNLPGYFGDDLARVGREARAAWDGLRRDIDRHKPKTVVLSSEMFLFSQDADGHQRFRRLLDELGAPIEAFCYVRAPAPYYLSYLQQKSKMSGEVLAPEPLKIRSQIETFEASFGRPVSLRAYDPARLVEGDVVADFAEWAIGIGVPDSVARGQRFNETLSAETMAISVANRRANCPDQDGRLVREHRLLLNQLRELEAKVGGHAKPRLRPEIGDAVTRASSDLHWLRDARGVAFGDIDYDAIDGELPEEIVRLGEIDRICEVDPARRERLTMALLQAGAEAQLALRQYERVLPVGRVLAARSRLRDAATRLARAARVRR